MRLLVVDRILYSNRHFLLCDIVLFNMFTICLIPDYLTDNNSGHSVLQMYYISQILGRFFEGNFLRKPGGGVIRPCPLGFGPERDVFGNELPDFFVILTA